MFNVSENISVFTKQNTLSYALLFEHFSYTVAFFNPASSVLCIRINSGSESKNLTAFKNLRSER
jgi:hypothetical protein